MAEQNEQVMARRLPSGEPLRVLLETVGPIGRTLRLAVGGGVFGCGDLVEVRTPAFIYLGEVRSVSDDLVGVAVEHILERSTLADIQRVWRRPEV